MLGYFVRLALSNMIRLSIKTTKPIGTVSKIKYANAQALQFGATALARDSVQIPFIGRNRRVLPGTGKNYLTSNVLGYIATQALYKGIET